MSNENKTPIEREKKKMVCAVRVPQAPITGTHVASMMEPTAHMPFPPPHVHEGRAP